MGYSLSWAALKNGTLEMICSACNLRPTGEQERLPKSKVVAASISTGWHLVLFKRCEIDDRILAKLSTADEVVSCYVEDHVMFSSASGWAGGKRIWRVIHNSEKGTHHLEIAGTPPQVLTEIQKQLTEKQDAAGGDKADVDYIYDIPVELAKALIGFRHDEGIQNTAGDAYVVLEAAIGGEKSLIARIVTMFKGSRPSSVLVLLLLTIILSPVILVGALISVPWIVTARLAGKRVQKRRAKRLIERMVLAGRTIEWRDVQRELPQGRGSLIVENPSFKGPWHLWWTPDTLEEESPFRFATSKTAGRGGHEFEFALFNKWCYENYTNPRSGKAVLVTSDEKMLPQQLEGYEYVRFFRLMAAKGKNSEE